MKAAITCGQRGYIGPELAKPLTISLQALFRKSGPPVKADGVIWDIRRAIRSHDLAHIKVAAAHPEFATPFQGEPASEAGVIRVQVRRNHPGDGFTVQNVCEDGAPVRLHALIEQACVHDGPAIAVTQQPDVDVIQSARHGHANPEDAVCDLRDFAWDGSLFLKSVRQRVKASFGHIVNHTLSPLCESWDAARVYDSTKIHLYSLFRVPPEGGRGGAD
jgi:hypothetical protein